MNKPPYWQPVGQPDGSVLSIDNIVINVTTYQPWSNVEGKLREIFGAENVRTPKRKSIYQEGWSIAIDQDSFFFAVTPREQGRLVLTKGRIDFNPNKLMRDERFLKFLTWLEKSTKMFDPARFDLAHDFPIAFYRILLMKDRRMLHTVTKDSTTYYLGTRNKPGFVRFYDKALENDMPSPLTRCEMTCDAKWSPSEIQRKAPRLIQLGEFPMNTRQAHRANLTTLGFARLMTKAALHGIDAQDELNALDYRAQKKVVALMEAKDLYLFSLGSTAQIKEQIDTWRRRKEPLRAIIGLTQEMG